MPYIVREDGEHFVIPSYRDVLSAKKKNLLKREILLLSSDYGEYIVLQRKNITQYEVAFSPDIGYLLGETVWHYFKRPLDLIYCEAIPNTNEAILVIVKAGSVYLDGSFPFDSIAEELVIFKTQQNNFAIYIYGDVPISQTPTAGKFAFDPASVKMFTVLDKPIFSDLPLLKAFHLQLVEPVLKAHGIGVFPVKETLMGLVALGLLWMGWTYISSNKEVLPNIVVGVVNPYQLYLNILTSPDPAEEVTQLANNIETLLTLPGWVPQSIEYADGKTRVFVKSAGARTGILFAWAKQQGVLVQVMPDGFYINMSSTLYDRAPPATISNLQLIVADMVDKLSYVLPDNRMVVSEYIDRKVFVETNLTINFTDITPATLELIGKQFRNLPLQLTKASIKVNNGNLSGAIVVKALGN